MWMAEADRKLRPLMPRPISSCSHFSTISNPSCCCIHNPNILPWNHQISGLGSEYGVKREIQTMPLVSTRWNPTPEQLQALEEMYKRGTRTPSAEQIQQIAAKLRRFGKIEGKNVFYWFQNHKARERQKKRRQLDLQLHPARKNQTGLMSRRYFEIEHHKKLSTLSNCSAPNSEDSAASMQYGTAIAECKKDEWTHLRQNKINVTTAKNESSCWKLDTILHTAAQNPALERENNNNKPPFATTTTNSSLTLSILLSTKNDDINFLEDEKSSSSTETRETRTLLQLFPTRSTDLGTRSEEVRIRNISTRFTPNHEFIEFLPTKN
ncbi:hypothetical protein ABFX02_12G069500 [Erythranthe guttata]